LAEYGVTDDGFIPKSVSQGRAGLNASLAEAFGAEWDSDPDKPNAQVVDAHAGADAVAWAALAEVATMLDPGQARGAFLSALVRLNGVERKPGTKSVCVCELGGVPSTMIPAGSLVRNDDGDLLQLTGPAIEIAASGLGYSLAFALEVGPVVVDAGSITEIVTPVSGWETVAVTTSGIIGADEEQDDELRLRRDQSTEAGAVSIIEALYAAIRSVDSVLDVKVVENKSLASDSLGIPGKSFMAVIDGGVDADIAQAIWAKHPMGIASHGSTTETVVDSEGVNQDVSFQRPADVEIYVSLTIAPDQNFPAGGDELIKQALVEFASGQLAGHESHRFGIGGDVEYSRLYTAINSVPGHTVSALTLGTAPAPVGTANIVITDAQISRWATSRIVVSS